MTTSAIRSNEVSRRGFISKSFRVAVGGLATVGAHEVGILVPTLKLAGKAGGALIDLAKNRDPEVDENSVVAPSENRDPQANELATVTPEEPVTATDQPVAAEATESGREALGDGWYLEPGYRDVIAQLNLEQHKKDFLVFAVENMAEVIRRGFLVNPRIAIAQTTLETGYGQHLAAKNNYFGQKPGKNDPAVYTMTKEDYGDGLVDTVQPFIPFETPLDSFLHYGSRIDSLKHYDDAEACRADDALAIRGIQNYADPQTCNIILPQGTKNDKGEIVVSSWATARDYEEIVLGLVKSLDLTKIFTRDA